MGRRPCLWKMSNSPPVVGRRRRSDSSDVWAPSGGIEAMLPFSLAYLISNSSQEDFSLGKRPVSCTIIVLHKYELENYTCRREKCLNLASHWQISKFNFLLLYNKVKFEWNLTEHFDCTFPISLLSSCSARFYSLPVQYILWNSGWRVKTGPNFA